MKNLFLALSIVFTAQSLFAQLTPKETWKPASFSKLSEDEQRIISSLTPVNQRNKAFVQLLLDIGGFESCGLGTFLKHDKIFVSVVDNKVATRYSYILNFDKALVSEDALRAQNGGQAYVLAFDQTTKSRTGELTDETILMYFLFKEDGSFVGMEIYSKKNSGFYPLISKFTGKVEASYAVSCKAK